MSLDISQNNTSDSMSIEMFQHPYEWIDVFDNKCTYINDGDMQLIPTLTFNNDLQNVKYSLQFLITT